VCFKEWDDIVDGDAFFDVFFGLADCLEDAFASDDVSALICA
jgi:hypothetical protein